MFKNSKNLQILVSEGVTNLHTLALEFDCRPVSMTILSEKMAFVSLLSNYIVALRLNGDSALVFFLFAFRILIKCIFLARFFGSSS